MNYESYDHIPPFIFPLQSLSGSRSGGESWKTCQCNKVILNLTNLNHAWSHFLSFPPFNEECKLKIVLEFKITHIKGFGFKINLIYLLLLTFYMLENCISKFQLELENILQLKDDRSWKPFHLVNWKSRGRRQYNEEKEAESHFSPVIFIKISIL